jgi:hypothetical protein
MSEYDKTPETKKVSMKARAPNAHFILSAGFGGKRLPRGTELRRESGTEAPTPASVQREWLNQLISNSDSRKHGNIALAIVRAVNDFVVLLREALKSDSGQNLQPRQQRDLILQIPAVRRQLRRPINRKIRGGWV